MSYLIKVVKKDFDVNVRIVKKSKLSSKFYYYSIFREKNNKIDGDTLLNNLENYSNFRTIAIIKEPLCHLKETIAGLGVSLASTEGLYGYSVIGGSVGAISIDAIIGKPNMLLNIGNVVLHEIGHTYGLYHCKNPYCYMFDGNGTTAEIAIEKYFCGTCYIKMHKKWKR